MLLDTCAVIWLANGDTLAALATEAIFAAARADGILVSPVSAWEIGLLSRPGARSSVLQFLPNPKAWFHRLMARPGIKAAPFTSEIAINASFLPGDLHGDPADRFIIATARHLGIPVVTRDRRIVAYAAAGNLELIAC